jgi:hypothetical protein
MILVDQPLEGPLNARYPGRRMQVGGCRGHSTMYRPLPALSLLFRGGTRGSASKFRVSIDLTVILCKGRVLLDFPREP